MPGAPVLVPAPDPRPVTSPQATAEPPPPDAADSFETATRAYEARLLQNALEACRFNQAEAARRLGLSYYQFRHHLRLHGMLAGRARAAE